MHDKHCFMKICKMCGVKKEYEFFGKESRMPDGLRSYCKSCIKEYYRRKEFKVKQVEFNDLDGEVWKDVVGYEGMYQVSNIGRVKGIDRLVMNKGEENLLKGCLRRQMTNTVGYKRVCLLKNSQKKVYQVHRLVAESFLSDKMGNGNCINHKNGVVYDNRVENLEWCTYKENINHALSTGLRKTKINKTQLERVIELYFIHGVKPIDIAKEMNVNGHYINALLYRHKKFKNLVYNE